MAQKINEGYTKALVTKVTLKETTKDMTTFARMALLGETDPCIQSKVARKPTLLFAAPVGVGIHSMILHPTGVSVLSGTDKRIQHSK